MSHLTTSHHDTYYVPDKSRLALFASLGLFLSLLGAGSIINHISAGSTSVLSWSTFILGLFILAATLFAWFRVTIVENRQGLNSDQLNRSYVIGMQWFIFSEIMFFFTFFGALFYVRTWVGPWLGGEGAGGRMNHLLWPGFEHQWPLVVTPQDAVGGVDAQPIANTGIHTGPDKHLGFPGWRAMFHWLPLWNTLVLLSSSVTCHMAHLGLLQGNRKKLNTWLLVTIVLGLFFVFLQYREYHEAYLEYGLTLASGIYGATFFMLTGFHGLHVCMGVIMLAVQWLRTATRSHFTPTDHFGFEASSWYWHFVDVVWVTLFLFVYIL